MCEEIAIDAPQSTPLPRLPGVVVSGPPSGIPHRSELLSPLFSMKSRLSYESSHNGGSVTHKLLTTPGDEGSVILLNEDTQDSTEFSSVASLVTESQSLSREPSAAAESSGRECGVSEMIPEVRTEPVVRYDPSTRRRRRHKRTSLPSSSFSTESMLSKTKKFRRHSCNVRVDSTVPRSSVSVLRASEMRLPVLSKRLRFSLGSPLAPVSHAGVLSPLAPSQALFATSKTEMISDEGRDSSATIGPRYLEVPRCQPESVTLPRIDQDRFFAELADNRDLVSSVRDLSSFDNGSHQSDLDMAADLSSLDRFDTQIPVHFDDDEVGMNTADRDRRISTDFSRRLSLHNTAVLSGDEDEDAGEDANPESSAVIPATADRKRGRIRKRLDMTPNSYESDPARAATTENVFPNGFQSESNDILIGGEQSSSSSKTSMFPSTSESKTRRSVIRGQRHDRGDSLTTGLQFASEWEDYGVNAQGDPSVTNGSGVRGSNSSEGCPSPMTGAKCEIAGGSESGTPIRMAGVLCLHSLKKSDHRMRHPKRRRKNDCFGIVKSDDSEVGSSCLAVGSGGSRKSAESPMFDSPLKKPELVPMDTVLIMSENMDPNVTGQLSAHLNGEEDSQSSDDEWAPHDKLFLDSICSSVGVSTNETSGYAGPSSRRTDDPVLLKLPLSDHSSGDNSCSSMKKGTDHMSGVINGVTNHVNNDNDDINDRIHNGNQCVDSSLSANSSMMTRMEIGDALNKVHTRSLSVCGSQLSILPSLTTSSKKPSQKITHPNHNHNNNNHHHCDNADLNVTQSYSNGGTMIGLKSKSSVRSVPSLERKVSLPVPQVRRRKARYLKSKKKKSIFGQRSHSFAVSLDVTRQPNEKQKREASEDDHGCSLVCVGSALQTTPMLSDGKCPSSMWSGHSRSLSYKDSIVRSSLKSASDDHHPHRHSISPSLRKSQSHSTSDHRRLMRSSTEFRQSLDCKDWKFDLSSFQICRVNSELVNRHILHDDGKLGISLFNEIKHSIPLMSLASMLHFQGSAATASNSCSSLRSTTMMNSGGLINGGGDDSTMSSASESASVVGSLGCISKSLQIHGECATWSSVSTSGPQSCSSSNRSYQSSNAASNRRCSLEPRRESVGSTAQSTTRLTSSRSITAPIGCSSSSISTARLAEQQGLIGFFEKEKQEFESELKRNRCCQCEIIRRVKEETSLFSREMRAMMLIEERSKTSSMDPTPRMGLASSSRGHSLSLPSISIPSQRRSSQMSTSSKRRAQSSSSSAVMMNEQFLTVDAFDLSAVRCSDPYASPLVTTSDERTLSRFAGKMPRISPEIMYGFLTGMFRDLFEHFVIVDCRYEYEYRAGHIRGALHLEDPMVLDRLFDANHTSGAASKTAWIFHCEFSQKRAVKSFQYVRKLDLVRNDYGGLSFPYLFLLEGGYNRFYSVLSNVYASDEHLRGPSECARCRGSKSSRRMSSFVPCERIFEGGHCEYLSMNGCEKQMQWADKYKSRVWPDNKGAKRRRCVVPRSRSDFHTPSLE